MWHTNKINFKKTFKKPCSFKIPWERRAKFKKTLELLLTRRQSPCWISSDDCLEQISTPSNIKTFYFLTLLLYKIKGIKFVEVELVLIVDI